MLFENAIGAMRPGAGVGDFLDLFVIVAGSILVISIVTAVFFEYMNARRPERKIQKNRVNHRKWKEQAYAPGSMGVVALSFSGGFSLNGRAGR